MDEKDKKLISYIRNLKESSKQFRSKWTDMWDECYELYFGYVELKKDKRRSNLFIPKSFEAVETLFPRYYFAFKEISTLAPTEVGDIELANMADQLLKYQFELSKLKYRIGLSLKDALILGTSVNKVIPKYRTVTIEELLRIFGLSELPLELQDKIFDGKIRIFEYPVAEEIDIYNFYVDPDATEIENASWCLDDTIRSREELREGQRTGIYKNVEMITDADLFGNWTETNARRDRMGITLTTARSVEKDKVLITEWWGKYDYDEDGIKEDLVVTIAAEKYILRVDKNPLGGSFPYVMFVPHPMKGELYGVSLLDIGKYEQYEINDIHNQIMDNWNIIIHKHWLVEEGANIDLDSLIRVRPGGYTKCNNLLGIKPVDMPDLSPSAQIREQIAVSNYQSTTGAFPNLQGAPLPRRETATTYQGLEVAGTTRVGASIEFLNENSIKPLVNKYLLYNAKYLTLPQAVRILGEKGKQWEIITINPEIMKHKFDVIPKGIDPLYVKEVKQINLMKAITVAQRVYPRLNGYRVAEMMFEYLDIPNASELLQDPDEEIIQFILNGVDRGISSDEILTGLINYFREKMQPKKIQKELGRAGVPKELGRREITNLSDLVASRQATLREGKKL
jgi:hypothetical protein